MAQGTGEPGIGKLSGMKRSRKPRKRSWIRRLLLILIVIGAIPVALTIFYLPPFIHPVSTLMAKDLVTLRGFTREWKPLSEISPRLVNSVMMSEDGQFCAHHGIDLGEFRAVLQDFLEGEPSRGGSTITMQTAKNLYLWHGRSYVRKAIELPYAVFLDAIMPKRRILEIYLNIVEWGPGIYGAEAAAQHHFGKSASNLTAREAALLAVTLPNPIARTPGKPTAALNRLASRIERRARQAGGYNHCVR